MVGGEWVVFLGEIGFTQFRKCTKTPSNQSGRDMGLRKTLSRLPRGSTKPNRLWRWAEEPTGNRSPSGFPCLYPIYFPRCKSARCQSVLVSDCHFDFAHPQSLENRGTAIFPLTSPRLPDCCVPCGFFSISKQPKYALYSVDLGNSNAFCK